MLGSGFEFVDARAHAIRPRRQVRLGKMVEKGIDAHHICQVGSTRGVGYLIARIETKLKHWNHVTIVENPTLESRWRCVSIVSGSSVFSSAVRF